MAEGFMKLVFSGALMMLVAFCLGKRRRKRSITRRESDVEQEAFTFEQLMSVLEPMSPEDVALLRATHGTVEHGLLSVGLKLHILADMPGITALVAELNSEHYGGGHKRPYRHADATYCIVLPPVGSASAAISLIKCLERTTRECLFHNQDVQIQVCSPHRLSPRHAAILAMAFYLGSDILRPYDLDDLKTTFSNNSSFPNGRRGQRITIYDYEGKLDKRFEYWACGLSVQGGLVIYGELPFENRRTDVLTCTSPDDIDNVNLVATLLVHREKMGWWGPLGQSFVAEFEKMLERHLLVHLLDAPWILHDEASQDDQPFYLALSELMAYAHEEAGRPLDHGRAFIGHQQVRKPKSILRETNDLLVKYDRRLRNESMALRDGGGA